MATDLYTFTVKDPTTIRDDILRTLRNGLIARGVSNPNVAPGSDYFILATAFANELAVVEANAVIKADELMPDTATGDALDRIVAIYGLARKDASSSSGHIVFDASAASAVVTGAELLDGSGLRYAVSAGGSYEDGDIIPIDAVDTGKETNLATSATLRWVSAPAYSSPTALVSTPGLTGGSAPEDDETLRARLYSRLRTPPASGNWQHLAELAEASSPEVQKAFVYPAIEGPATVYFAVAAAATETNKNRNVDSTTVSTTVVPYVQGQMPEHAYILGTTVTNVNTDVAIFMTLPAALNASPPGEGGGWLDGTPWPVRGTPYYCDVTAVTSTTVFTVNASAAPTNSVSRIAFLSPSDWTVYTAKVISYTGTGPYTVTVDTPMVGIAVGSYVWPQAVNQQAYVDALLGAFALMGPGELTDNVTTLARAYRHPTPQQSWVASMGATQLRAISDAGDEVLDTSYAYRSETTPDIPGDVTDPPNILVPRNLGFYPTQ